MTTAKVLPLFGNMTKKTLVGFDLPYSHTEIFWCIEWEALNRSASCLCNGWVGRCAADKTGDWRPFEWQLCFTLSFRSFCPFTQTAAAWAVSLLSFLKTALLSVVTTSSPNKMPLPLNATPPPPPHTLSSDPEPCPDY